MLSSPAMCKNTTKTFPSRTSDDAVVSCSIKGLKKGTQQFLRRRYHNLVVAVNSKNLATPAMAKSFTMHNGAQLRYPPAHAQPSVAALHQPLVTNGMDG